MILKKEKVSDLYHQVILTLQFQVSGIWFWFHWKDERILCYRNKIFKSPFCIDLHAYASPFINPKLFHVEYHEVMEDIIEKTSLLWTDTNLKIKQNKHIYLGVWQQLRKQRDETNRTKILHDLKNNGITVGSLCPTLGTQDSC